MPYKTHIRRSMAIQGISEKTAYARLAELTCILLGHKRRDVAAYAATVDAASKFSAS